MTRSRWSLVFAALIVSPEPAIAQPAATFPAPCTAVVSNILAQAPTRAVRVRISLFDPATSRLRTGQADLTGTASIASGSVVWSDDSGSATVHLSPNGIVLDIGEGKHAAFAPGCSDEVITGSADAPASEAIAMSIIEPADQSR